MYFKKLQKYFFLAFFIVFWALIISAQPIFSEEFTSTNYKSLDPVLTPSGYATSSGFQLWSNITQIAVGTSSTAINFGVNAGFLTFPAVSTPVVSATAGNSQVALSWTASIGFLGWNVSGYDVGRATISGGPYTYTTLGNVTSYTSTSLTNGTPYYFIVRPQDAFSNSIATSSQVSATPVAPVVSGGSGGGGGGGGGVISPPPTPTSQTTVMLSGRAYPNSKVILLKDGQLSIQTIAGPDANFEMSLTNLSAGSYNFGVYGEDKDKRRSATVSFPITLTAGATTKISGIYLAPSIATDKSEVRKGDTIAIFGQSVPRGNITIQVNSEQELFTQAHTDSNGVYLVNFDTVPLELGQHSTQARSATSTEVSQFGLTALFKVGTKNVLATSTVCPLKGDLNDDCRVNLVDFSIAAYWYKRPLSVSVKDLEKAKLSGDGLVNLVDFSIMAYYWTG